MIQTNENEAQWTHPVGLQLTLDFNARKSRMVFVQLSGTESVVQVYAEAETNGDANQTFC